MKARVIKEFTGALDGEHYPKRFHVGDVIDGSLAKVAIGEKWAEPDRPRARAASAGAEPAQGEPEALAEQGASASNQQAPENPA